MPRCRGDFGGARGERERGDVEIVVTDDSSDDATRQLVAAHYPWARWTRGPRRGPAANRNHGVRETQGAWIVFTDDDCLPAPGWLAALFARMANAPGCNVLEGKTVADRQRRRLDEESPVNPRGGGLWSCNMAVRRTLFEHVGGFCETFPYAAMEDVDLRLRLLAGGERLEFVADAVVCHPYRAAKGLRFAGRAGESFVHLVARHPHLLGARPWWTLVANLLRRAKALLEEAVRCRFRGFGYAVGSLGVAAYFEVIARLPRARQARIAGCAGAALPSDRHGA